MHHVAGHVKDLFPERFSERRAVASCLVPCTWSNVTHMSNENPSNLSVNEAFTDVEFSLGDKLRKLRQQTFSSGEQLSAALGVNRVTVNNYELDNIKKPNLKILLNWCLQTGGRPSEVMGGEFAHLDEPALQKIIEIRRRRAAELAVLDHSDKSGIDRRFEDMLSLEHGDADQGQTSPWRFPGAPDQWVVAS